MREVQWTSQLTRGINCLLVLAKSTVFHDLLRTIFGWVKIAFKALLRGYFRCFSIDVSPLPWSDPGYLVRPRLPDPGYRAYQIMMGYGLLP